MKQARLTSVLGSVTPNGREKKLQLRAGKQGKGEVLHTIIYWPWSDRSVDQAYQWMDEYAARHNIEIVSD